MILEAYCKIVLHEGCALVSYYHKWEDCPVQPIYMNIAKRHQANLQKQSFTIGYHINDKQLVSDLRQVQEKTGDYLAIMDSLIEEFEKYVTD